MSNSELALYLRCSNAVKEEKPRKCDETCPYFLKERVPDEHPDYPADLIVDGVRYWTGCDYEQISEDAADVLEAMEDDGK